MKKIAILLLALAASSAHADPTDVTVRQRNVADTGYIDRFIAFPAGGVSCLFSLDGPTVLPSCYTLGSGLSLTSGVLSATATAQVNADWAAVSGIAQILNKPATFTPSAHTQAWGTITGTPSTRAGYGITDALGTSDLTPYATTSALTSGLATKFTTPTGTTAQYVRGDGSLATLPVPATPSQASASRSLNSSFQISATRNALVSYSVQLTVTASISGGQNGDVILEIASDSGFTTNVQTLAITGLGQTYTLAVALQGVQPQTGVVSGYVPAGYYARLRTANNTGTPAYSYRAGQEIQL